MFLSFMEMTIKNIESQMKPYGIHKYLLTLKRYNYKGDFYLQNPINLLSPTFVLTLQEICFNEGYLYKHTPHWLLGC